MGCFCLFFGQLHDMHDIHDFKQHNIPRCLWLGRCCPYPYPLGHKIFEGDAMIAHDLIQRAADSGVVLYLAGDELKARGSRQAVETLSPELRAHKAEIVKMLAGARTVAANDPTRSEPGAPENLRKPQNAPAVNDLANSVLSERENLRKPVVPPADSDAWRELAQAYHAHHFKCPVCIAAGRGSNYGERCSVGLALWRAYDG